MSEIYPVLLAGGLGTRLWPLSRKSYPKQFSNLIGNTTLFQSSAQRLLSSDILQFAQHITITNSDFRFIVCDQLQEIGIDPGPVLIEPEARNTAAAILAVSIFLQQNDQNALMLVAPSDHLIPDRHDFHEAIQVGLSQAQKGKMVTFGIKPTHPETGYGYLELSTHALDSYGTSNVLNFVEKPDENHAKWMLANGKFFWNAGIFLFRAADMISAFKVHAPETLELVSQAVNNASEDFGFLRLSAEPWSMINNVSIDYAIMEKARNLVAVPYKSKWSDLGGWDAIWAERNPDSFGNVTSVSAHAIDCTNSLLRSETSSQQVVGIGLNNIIAVSMNDAVLVADKKHAQEVKKAAELLKKKGISQAEIFPKDHRPWGWFEKLASGDRFQVKCISVKPGGALSLQSHNHRSEHWVVVKGTAEITINDDSKMLVEGQSVYVPLGAIHRLKNPGKTPVVLIEVQIGAYLGEDDIIRYEDVYLRD